MFPDHVERVLICGWGKGRKANLEIFLVNTRGCSYIDEWNFFSFFFLPLDRLIYTALDSNIRVISQPGPSITSRDLISGSIK